MGWVQKSPHKITDVQKVAHHVFCSYNLDMLIKE